MCKVYDIFAPNIRVEGKALATFSTTAELEAEHEILKAILLDETEAKWIQELAYEQIQIVECAISILDMSSTHVL